jgi:phosphoribosyl 1,2-cyclic phosphodiesterase
MKVHFWGVRGSYPVPGPGSVRYGGNTSCVEVRCGDPQNPTRLILDAGTGLRRLSKELMLTEFGEGKGRAHLLVSHTHWDHIQGLPFFTPAFTPENHFVIYGEARPRYSLVELMADQIQHPFFPVEMQDLFRAQIDFRELACGDTVEIHPQIRVTAFRLTHPNAALGYVLQLEDIRVAYVTDHEHTLERL